MGSKIKEFAKEVIERSAQSLKLIAQLNAKLSSKVQQHINNIQDLAIRIQNSQSTAQSEDELRNLMSSISRTRKNQNVLEELLESMPQSREEL
jgi:hypothetical protein